MTKEYKLTVSADGISISPLNEPEFCVGDAVQITDDGMDYGKYGVIREVRDMREYKMFIPSGRGWYYRVAYATGETLLKWDKIKLIAKK